MYCVKLNELDFLKIYSIILNNLFNTQNFFKAFSEGVEGPEGSPLRFIVFKINANLFLLA